MSEENDHFNRSIDSEYTKIEESILGQEVDIDHSKSADEINVDSNSNKFIAPPKTISSLNSPSSLDVDSLLVNSDLGLNSNKRHLDDDDDDDLGESEAIKKQQLEHVIATAVATASVNADDSDDLSINFDHTELKNNQPYDFNLKLSLDPPCDTSDVNVSNPANTTTNTENNIVINNNISNNKIVVASVFNPSATNLNPDSKSKVIKFAPNRTTDNIKKPHLLLTNPNSRKCKREPTKGPPKNSRFFKVYTLDGSSKISKPSSIHHYNPYRYPQNRSKLNPHPDFIKSKKDEILPDIPASDIPTTDNISEETSNNINNSNSPYSHKIPELKPTMEEFEDIYSYIESIKDIGEKYGAVKIIPPKEFSPKFSINLESFWIKSKRQLWRSSSEELNARYEFYRQLKVCLKAKSNYSIHKLPCIDKRAIDLYRLFRVVTLRGGFENCCNEKLWAQIGRELGFYGKISSSLSSSIKSVYQKYLLFWENECKEKNLDFLNISRNDESSSLMSAEKAKDSSDIPVILGSSSSFIRSRETLLNAGFSTYFDQSTTQKKGITLSDLQTLPDYDFYQWSGPLLPEDTDPSELKISSLYTLKQFHDKSRILKSQVLNKFHSNDHNKFDNINYLENTYWKLLENPDVMFETEVSFGQSTNIHDSSYEYKFLTEKNSDLSDSILSSLNFNNTTISDGSLLQFANSDSDSIFHSYLNFSMFYGTQSWSLEDHWLYNIDYHYLGDAKSIYVIPPAYQKKYEELIIERQENRKKERINTIDSYLLFEREIGSMDIYNACIENQVCYDMNLPRSRPNDLGFEPMINIDSIPIRYNSDLIFSPEFLKKKGIPVYHTFQEVGNFIIKFPKAYSCHFSLGTSITEAVNIANTSWVNESINASLWLQKQFIPNKFSTFSMLLTAARESNDIKILKNIKPVLENLIKNEINKRNEIRKLIKEVKFSSNCNSINHLNDLRGDINEIGNSQDIIDNDEETVGTKLAFKLGNWNKVTDFDMADMFPTFVCAKNSGNKQSNFTISMDGYLKFEENDSNNNNNNNNNNNKKYVFELISLVDDEYLIESIDFINDKLINIKDWFTKYHDILSGHAIPPIDKSEKIYKQGEILFNEKNLKIEEFDLIEEHAFKQFKFLKKEILFIKKWMKKVKLFYEMKNKGVKQLLPFKKFKQLVEDIKFITISTKEIEEIKNLANEIIEFENIVKEPLERYKEYKDNIIELKRLFNLGSKFGVELESFKLLDKIITRTNWIEFINNDIKNINDLENAVQQGKKYSPKNENDLKLLNDIIIKYEKSKELYEKFKKIKEIKEEKISIKEIKELIIKCDDLPLNEIKEYFKKLEKEYEIINDTIIPFINLIKEKNESIKEENNFINKVEKYLKYYERINKEISIEKIKNCLWVLEKIKDFEDNFKILSEQVIKNPVKINKEIKEKFSNLLNFGKFSNNDNDDFKFNNMSKIDCLNYLTRYNLDLLKSNEDKYCVCRQMHEGNMVECEHCKEWFHFNCIGYTNEENKYICPLCDYESKYITTKNFYSDVNAKIKFEEMYSFSNLMMENSCILTDYEIKFLEIVLKIFKVYKKLIKDNKIKEFINDKGEEEMIILETDKNKIRKLLQKIGGCTYGVGLNGFNTWNWNIISKGSFSTTHLKLHSHSHSESHSHSHGDEPENNVHHYYEYTPNQGTKKTATFVDGKKIIPEDDDLVPKRKTNGHHHVHSHSEYPEMESMDLNGEDFTINVNPKRNTLWTKIKHFFNPNSPLSEMMGPPDLHLKNDNNQNNHSILNHSHSHASDEETMKLYDPKNLANEGVKITWIGFGVNCSMAITKFIGGFYFHSQALIADAIHAVGDLISDVLTLTTVRFTNKKADALYPFGYGKIETFGSFTVSFILLYAGFQIGWSSLYEIIAPIIPNTLNDLFSMIPTHSHSHGVNEMLSHDHNHDHDHNGINSEVANINAAWLALASIGVKEWLFRATRKVGERLNSKVLIANAWHHRVDSLTSVVAVATISTGYFLNIYWLDSIGGLLVSMLIMKVGISGVVQSFKELIDKAIPISDKRYTNIEDSINVILMKKDNHILIRELSVLPSGTNLNIVLKLGVSPFDKTYENQLTLEQMGSIGEFLKAELIKEFHNIKHVSIQFVSNNNNNVEKNNESKTEINSIKNDKAEEEKHEHTIHEHSLEHTHAHSDKQ
ncbi:hypothetical protein C6P40_005055 [Pichia californica]|uniref:Uncharacterized protein n=1 Tax=Pichia californica TaxID=460514 RepID=A0A9P7BG00_9ASCO|nr:hypothetical protein C6P40_005055 [[Candida] californica]